MNKIEFQKRTSPRFGRDKKLAGIHLMIEKPHPNRSIELRSNPAWTWTHWRNDHVIQQITSINWDWQHNWPHIKDHALQRMFQITCQYNNLQKRTQNHHSEPINFTITKQKCWRNMHVSLPCSFSPTTHQLWIKLNAEIQKNLTTMIVGNKAPMLKPHLRDLNTQARKSSEKFFGILNKGKLAVVKPKMARLSPHEHFGNSCVFQSSPFVSAEAMNESSKLMQMPRRTWTTNSWTSTSTFELEPKRQISLHTLIHPCKRWRNWDIDNTKITIFFFNRDTLTKFGPPTDKNNRTFALGHVQESL